MNMQKLESFGDKTAKILSALALVLLCAFFLYLLPASFLESSVLSTADQSGEHIDFYQDSFFLNLIVLSLQLSTMYLFYRHCRTEYTRRMEIELLVWVFAFGTAFIASAKLQPPSFSDSFVVTYGAQRAALGDFAVLSENYFRRFPFQLGYVLYSELYFRIAGFILRGSPEGYAVIALQEVNLLWLLLMLHALVEITGLLYPDPRIRELTMLLAFFCLPPVLTTPFLYGNIPAFSCGTLAVWMFLLFMRDGRLRHGLLCAVSLAAAVTLKLNLLIFCVAVGGVWMIELFRRFSLKSALCLALTLVFVFTFSALPQKLYEQRVGVDYGDGIPMIAWMAMGLSEGHAAPGWYSEEHTVTVFEESGHDRAATSKAAKAAIIGRLETFAHDPSYALHFFTQKLRSQWNEPSFGSLWLSRLFPSFSEKGGFYRFLCESGQRRTLYFMNTFQQLVYLGVLLGILKLWRRKDLQRCLLPVILLGGLLYHLLFEAKSQYAMPYFVMMIPVAAYGFHTLFRKVEKRA